MTILLLATLGACTDTGDTADTAPVVYHHVTLTQDPDPPTAGTEVAAELTVMLDGENLEGATVDLVPWMPDHDHGLSDEVEVIDEGGGIYSASFVYSMAGHWELQIEVTSEAGTDAHAFDVDVE